MGLDTTSPRNHVLFQRFSVDVSFRIGPPVQPPTGLLARDADAFLKPVLTFRSGSNDGKNHSEIHSRVSITVRHDGGDAIPLPHR